MLKTLLTSITAVFIMLPVLFYFIVFLFMRKWTKNGRMARNFAINSTTVVLIFSVHFIIFAIWAKSMLFLILLFMLVTAITFTYIYWKVREEINYPKVFLGFWRLNFLLFSVIYIGLLLYGTISRAIHSVIGT